MRRCQDDAPLSSSGAARERAEDHVHCDECGEAGDRMHHIRVLGAELCCECAELLRVSVRCGVCGDLYDAHDSDIRKVEGSFVGCWECRFCVEACEAAAGWEE